MMRSTDGDDSSTSNSEDDVWTVPPNASIPWGNAEAAPAPAPAADDALSLSSASDQAQKNSVSMSGMRWSRQVAGDTTTEASGGEDVLTVLDSQYHASRTNTNHKQQREIFQPPMSVEISNGSEGRLIDKTANLSGHVFLTESNINLSVARGSFMAAGAAQSVVGGRKSTDDSTVSSFADDTKKNSRGNTNKSIGSSGPSPSSFCTEDSNNNNNGEGEDFGDAQRANNSTLSKRKPLALLALLLLVLAGLGFGFGACFGLGFCEFGDSSSSTTTSSSNAESEVGRGEDEERDNTPNSTPIPTIPVPSASPSTSVQATLANSPSPSPSEEPDSEVPTAAPTISLTPLPTNGPSTISPTPLPSNVPSRSPTLQPSTANSLPSPTQTPTPTPILDTIRINIGAPSPLTDAQGLQWPSDNLQIGKEYQGDACLDPETASVYCTNRWFTDENSNNMIGSYRIAVSVELPGNYRVRLHFAELFHDSPGKRIFDVLVEGILVADDLDVFAEVGLSPYIVETDPLPCLDGTLLIELVRQKENPILNAIEVIYDSPFSPSSPFQLKLQTVEDLHNAVDDYLDGKLLTPINSFNVSALTNFSEAFSADRNPKAATFNENLDRWNMSNAESLWGMFRGAEAFNGDISTWDTSRVTDMAFMFDRATSFRGKIGTWDTSSCRSMYGTFRFAESFNSTISFWDVSSVETFSGMFLQAKAFHQALLWNVRSGKSFNRMFEDATEFHGSLLDWKTDSALEMEGMFRGAVKFNSGSVAYFNVSGVSNFRNMFSGASSFNQNLCSFGDQLRGATNNSVLRANLNLTSMFADTSCPETQSPFSPEGPWCQPCAFGDGDATRFP